MSVENVKIEKTEKTIKGTYKGYGFEIDISNEARLDEIIEVWLEQIKKIEKEMVD